MDFGSGFETEVTNHRIINLLVANKFTFEKFLKRDGVWERANKTGKIMHVCLTVFTGLVYLLFVPITIYYWHYMEKVSFIRLRHILIILK